MAGNPFRRSTAPSRQHAIDLSDAPRTPQQRTQTKRVKIESPPLSFPSRADGEEGLPPPPSDDDDHHRHHHRHHQHHHHNDDDDDDYDSETDENTGRTLDSPAQVDEDSDQVTKHTTRSSTSTAKMGNGMKAPYNPFARTLATREADLGLQRDDGTTSTQREGHRQRPAMDVDAFKNILLTGSASGTSSPSAAVRKQRSHDSDSSTNTSSLFHPTYTIHPESPGVDHYQFSSDHEDDNHDDDDDDNDNDDDDDNDHVPNDHERSNLMGQGGRLDDLAPPAPPKPQPRRGPQTVSFADFDQSIPLNFQAPGGRGTPPLGAQRGILRPTIHRSGSDLNKPLPPAPGERKWEDATPPPAVPDKDVPQEVISAIEDDPSTPKKLPPPPPASRRQAAAASGTGRPRSASNLSTHESTSDIPDPVVLNSLPDSEEPSHKSSQPPPPPPARKVHPLGALHSSNTTAAIDDPSTHIPPEAKPLVPPPPPRRNPSTSGSLRTASPANSLRKHGISSGAGNGAAAPPPLPPPRRAGGVGGNGSQRSSIDGRPTSLRKFGGMENQDQRRVSERSFESIGSERAAPSPSTEAAKRDVLADMAAFEAEIDALRLQAGSSSSSSGIK